MALLVTPRLVLMLVLSFMALDTTQGQSCPSFTPFMDCIPNFVRSVGWSYDVLRLNNDDFPTLCRSFVADDVEGCIHSAGITCKPPFEFNGVVPAIKFICNQWESDSEYKTKYRTCFKDVPKLQSCLVMYPQAMPMGAKHIVNKAENLLNLSPSEKTDAQIHSAICIHLSTSRDIFCSESVLRAKCGKAAGEWHSTFTKTLFNITPGSLQDVNYRDGSSVFKTNLDDCSNLYDPVSITACELSNKCVPVLNNFAMNVRFGVFTFTASDLDSFCGFSDADLQTCVSQVVSHCSLIDVFTYTGSLMVHKKLCSAQYKAQYLQHRESLSASVSTTGFSAVLGCTDELMNSYKSAFISTLDAKSVETTLCNAAAAYLTCLKGKLTALCNEDAAKFQRKMTRFMIVQAFQQTFCTSVFDFDDMEKSVQGEDHALKANELNTALLVATVMFVIWSNYIKCLFYD